MHHEVFQLGSLLVVSRKSAADHVTELGWQNGPFLFGEAEFGGPCMVHVVLYFLVGARHAEGQSSCGQLEKHDGYRPGVGLVVDLLLSHRV